ncbi:Cysteine-rich RLK (RECEPTOR-like protein kinase) 8 [Cucumis melo var. makuwa]|uniref:Cysteine-rich RLK (RECEPTOR-like protein kinase) 8 n=1 Tax=Cucumis melo var. makuwa TaxID=1194695 RepID=A0A5D3C4Y2_CUCMM|nr:Cysteine-rich RLK (RECEPTOR-like protein kinase) 8 [Cucumis melo var. makuwa]
MGNKFEIKYLRNLKYFLGMEVVKSKEDDKVPVDKEQYCLVGKLIYLPHTRPYISFVVSQFMLAPYEEHMEAINIILRYLKTTPDIYLKLFYLSLGHLVTWRSKKQGVVFRISAKVEYKAMSLGIYISITNNLVQYNKTRHVEIDRHFIKERLDDGSICISYIPSNQQVANVLTKGLLR